MYANSKLILRENYRRDVYPSLHFFSFHRILDLYDDVFKLESLLSLLMRSYMINYKFLYSFRRFHSFPVPVVFHILVVPTLDLVTANVSFYVKMHVSSICVLCYWFCKD